MFDLARDANLVAGMASATAFASAEHGGAAWSSGIGWCPVSEDTSAQSELPSPVLLCLSKEGTRKSNTRKRVGGDLLVQRCWVTPGRALVLNDPNCFTDRVVRH